MIYRTKGHISIDGLPMLYWVYDVRYIQDAGADYEIEGNFYRREELGEELTIQDEDENDLTAELKGLYLKDPLGEFVSIHDHLLAMAEYDENHGRGYWA